MGQDARVVVVGGGIGGLAAAIALRQAGLEAVVVERSAVLEPLGAGLTLWANAVGALEHLGLADALRDLAVPELDGGIRTWRGDLLVSLSTDELQRRFGEVSVAVHRADLQRLLVEVLPADALQLGVTCRGLVQDAAGVRLTLTDGSDMHCAAVIGADGLRSVVRAALFGASPPRYAGYTAWRGVTGFDHHQVVSGETWGRGMRFGLVRLSRSRVYWFAAANAARGAPDGPHGRKQELLDRFRDWHAPIQAVIEATDERAILRNDIFDRPPLRHWSVGRVTLLGDAAHPMTPDLGQGACQALEDAVVLGRCLGATPNVRIALARYERGRLPRANAIARQSRLLGRVGQ